jgi:hypothetical protein
LQSSESKLGSRLGTFTLHWLPGRSSKCRVPTGACGMQEDSKRVELANKILTGSDT